MQSSGWNYSRRLNELNAAQRWGCASPADYDALDKDARIDILAWYEAHWRMDAVNAWEAQREAEAKANQARRKARGRR
jgi:hypothetical protein